MKVYFLVMNSKRCNNGMILRPPRGTIGGMVYE